MSNGMFPEISTTAPNSPTASREGERDAGEDGREEVREDDSREDRQATGAEQRRGGLLHLAVELDHRLHGANDERKRHEQQRHEHGETRVGDVDPERPRGP